MRLYLGIKRLFDFLFSLFLLILFSPLFFVLFFAVKLDSKGPIFFIQERLGYQKKVFRIYKFRTMIDKAESVGTGVHTSETDMRITRMGKLLRKTSLDELPQLFNILKGDMSFIGPRPPVTYYPYAINEYPEDANIRFNVRPGISGYAQINGRATLSWDEKFVFDKYYVEHLGIVLETKIFFKTIIKVLTLSNTYKNEAKKNEK